MKNLCVLVALATWVATYGAYAEQKKPDTLESVDKLAKERADLVKLEVEIKQKLAKIDQTTETMAKDAANITSSPQEKDIQAIEVLSDTQGFEKHAKDEIAKADQLIESVNESVDQVSEGASSEDVSVTMEPSAETTTGASEGAAEPAPEDTPVAAESQTDTASESTPTEEGSTTEATTAPADPPAETTAETSEGAAEPAPEDTPVAVESQTEEATD
ncbi:MAG: hypothetical protein LBF56_00640 [Holosporales bacterium]|jgi:hypothetical protein|nr:hypothetical protein [Holosporales bacterium]